MQKYSMLVRGGLICLGCLLVCSVYTIASAQQQEQQEPLEQLQQQIVTVRSEFKQWVQRAEDDREAIQEYVEKHLEELLSQQDDSQPRYSKLQEHVERVHTAIGDYSTGIETLEQAVVTFETAMNDQLDQIEAKLADIKARGLPKPRRVSEPVATPPASGQEPEAPPEEVPPLEIPPGQLFRAAYKFYMEGDYDTAIAGFQKYLLDYPNTQLTGAAQYWIAESLSKLEEYDVAIEEYDRLITDYPQNEKLADAYYGKGMALLKLGQTTEAKSLFQHVLDHFRGTIAAKKAGNRLQELP